MDRKFRVDNSLHFEVFKQNLLQRRMKGKINECENSEHRAFLAIFRERYTRFLTEAEEWSKRKIVRYRIMMSTFSENSIIKSVCRKLLYSTVE